MLRGRRPAHIVLRPEDVAEVVAAGVLRVGSLMSIREIAIDAWSRSASLHTACCRGAERRIMCAGCVFGKPAASASSSAGPARRQPCVARPGGVHFN